MANTITRDELEKEIKELQDVLKLMPPTARMCKLCKMIYKLCDDSYNYHSTTCYCDYDSPRI